MITLGLVIAHSRSKNENFQPFLLYFGTVIIDIHLLEVLGKIFA